MSIDHQPPKRTEAYLWRREFSHEQCQKVAAISSFRSQLPEDVRSLARYCRCQLKRSDRAYNLSHSFDGTWHGQPAYFQPNLRPTSVDYAMKVYAQALRDLHAHYPDFDKHGFIDGDRLGERRIVFPANLDQAAICWLRCRIWQLHEHSDLAVSESFVWKEARQEVVGRLTIEFDLALDREVMDKTTWEEVSAVIKEGRPFPVSTQVRKHDCSLVNEMLADVSLPELVLLNWNEARRPLSAADESLLKSVEEFDIPGIQHALHEGADPNCIDTHNDTPLVNLIDRWGHMGDIEYMKAQGQDISRYPSVEKLIEVINLLVHHGADVRMSAPDACNALSSACLVADARVVQCLLNHGGDPNIECYMDEYPSSWGSAWDSADYRCNPVIDNHDKTAWETLVARFPEPFSQVSISENPAN